MLFPSGASPDDAVSTTDESIDPPLYVSDILRGTAVFPFSPMPTAGLDVFDFDTALTFIGQMMPPPHRHETFVTVLDHDRRGIGIATFANTSDPDDVLHIADMVTETAHSRPDVGGAIIATFRPGGSDELDDVERWLTIDEQFGIVGIELVEWFVFGGAVSRPRSLVGEPSRWEA